MSTKMLVPGPWHSASGRSTLAQADNWDITTAASRSTTPWHDDAWRADPVGSGAITIAPTAGRVARRTRYWSPAPVGTPLLRPPLGIDPSLGRPGRRDHYPARPAELKRSTLGH